MHPECHKLAVAGQPHKVICRRCYEPAVLMVDGEVEELLPSES
jgi:hypothetical protein